MAARYSDVEDVHRRGQDYTPERIGWWLSRWSLLVSLVESPRTSVHHLQVGHNHKERDGRPCSPGPRIPGGRPSDGLSWALIHADLVAAANSLPIGSMERHVVYLRITRGGPVRVVAKLLRTRKESVREAEARALVLMAGHLGWLDDCEGVGGCPHSEGGAPALVEGVPLPES